MTRKIIIGVPEIQCKHPGCTGSVRCTTCDGMPEQSIMCPLCEWRGRQPCSICRMSADNKLDFY